MEKHLKDCGFDKYYKKLVKKLKNKTVIIYGTGTMFQYILKHYDLSKLNIIGVSDGKYVETDYGKEDFGYKIIPLKQLENYEPDYLILGVQNYLTLLYKFAGGTFEEKKTMVVPLVRIPFLKLLKEIWSK